MISKNELIFHLVVIAMVITLCFLFLLKRATNFDRNYPNPIPFTNVSSNVESGM